MRCVRWTVGSISPGVPTPSFRWRRVPDGPEGVKRYDLEAVGAFPEILAKAGLEVYRKPKKAISSRPQRKK
jgi:hypothetical protein